MGFNPWRMWEEVRPYTRHLVALFFLSLLATPLALLTPLPIKIVADNVIGSHPLPALVGRLLPAAVQDSKGGLLSLAVALVVAVALLSQLREFACSLLTAYAGEDRKSVV